MTELHEAAAADDAIKVEALIGAGARVDLAPRARQGAWVCRDDLPAATSGSEVAWSYLSFRLIQLMASGTNHGLPQYKGCDGIGRSKALSPSF